MERAFKILCTEKAEWQLVRGKEELAERLGIEVDTIPSHFLSKVTINGRTVSEIRLIVPEV